jgi:hypothetical protein
MKIHDVLTPSFRQLHHQLGHDRTGCQHAMWQQRLSSDSDFCRAVVANGYLTRQQMQHAAQRYLLGRSRDGGVIFWQMVSTEQVFDGKIMYYRTDCHRDHERHPQWVSNLLKRHYLQQCPQLASYMPTFCHCLFGTHLLSTSREGTEVGLHVCVVEAEKTAVILSEHYPQQLWMAAGGLFELTAQKLFPLRHHKVTLFPDTDTDGKAYTRWYDIVHEARRLYGIDITVSSLLERRATPEQKQRKIDLIDFLFDSPSLNPET